MASYQEQLRHPKWQKKRLEIMQRANFSCGRCGANDSMLSVHHTYYEKGCLPWQYPDSSLHCLCERCHEYAQLMMVALNRQLGLLGLDQIETLLGYGRGLQLKKRPSAVVAVHSINLANGIADAFRMKSTDVLKRVCAGKLSFNQTLRVKPEMRGLVVESKKQIRLL